MAGQPSTARPLAVAELTMRVVVEAPPPSPKRRRRYLTAAADTSAGLPSITCSPLQSFKTLCAAPSKGGDAIGPPGSQPEASRGKWCRRRSRVFTFIMLVTAGLTAAAFFMGFQSPATIRPETTEKPTEERRFLRRAITRPPARQAVPWIPSPARQTLSLVIETVLDVDGDLQFWRRSLHLKLLTEQPIAITAGGSLWKEASTTGCSGELISHDAGVALGQLGCPGAKESAAAARPLASPPTIEGSAAGGVLVGWLGDAFFIAAGKPDWAAAAAMASKGTPPRVAVFATVEPPSDWAKLAMELRDLPRSDHARFDPQLRISLGPR